MRPLLSALLAVCAVGGLLAVSAAADPGHAKNAAHVRAICGTQTVNVVVNGNGTFTPRTSSAAPRCSSRRRCT